jgi:hypothetical protein
MSSFFCLSVLVYCETIKRELNKRLNKREVFILNTISRHLEGLLVASIVIVTIVKVNSEDDMCN